jgi:hypothetical protein
VTFVAAEEMSGGTFRRLQRGVIIDGGRDRASLRCVKLEQNVPVVDDGCADVFDRQHRSGLAGRATRSSRRDAVGPVKLESDAFSFQPHASGLRGEPLDDDLTNRHVRDLLSKGVGRVVPLNRPIAENERLLRVFRMRLQAEVAVHKVALDVVVSLSVVEVERSVRGSSGEVDGHDERNGIAPHQSGGTTDEVSTRDDMATSLENWNGFEWCRDLDMSTAVRSTKVCVVRKVVIVRLRVRGAHQ